MRRALPGTTELYHVSLNRGDDLAMWRKKAREMAAACIPPEHIVWSLKAGKEADLFEADRQCGSSPLAPLRLIHANAAFFRIADSVILHRDNTRFARLYRLLWRLQDDPHLMNKSNDLDLHRLTIMAGQVRRDIHKMRAFVRFRMIEEDHGRDRYVAWFEPDHHILRANADFFLNRFASQRWSILTPELCLHWDGNSLSEAPGADRRDAPSEDATEDLWRRYYASIFNPARLKVSMMVKEMPRRYWKNLPEAQLIPELIAGAQAREVAMVARGSDPFKQVSPASLEEIARGIGTCRACPISCNGTRAVAGEGPSRAPLMIVGEQPGDSEEREGRPFVGPAGQLLKECLARVGVDQSRARLTNAVKHFKFELRGKRRIHQSPSASEIDRCRWWLDAERRLIQPAIILALGASAGRAILGRTPSIARERGTITLVSEGARLLLTAHPSYLLRLEGDARSREEARFQEDLMVLSSVVRSDC